MNNMTCSSFFVLYFVFALASLLHGSLAYDPSPLQDFCIADLDSSGFNLDREIHFFLSLFKY